MKVPVRNTGDWYHNCDLAKAHWHKHLMQARADNRPADEIRWLKQLYDEACYVGD